MVLGRLQSCRSLNRRQSVAIHDGMMETLTSLCDRNHVVSLEDGRNSVSLHWCRHSITGLLDVGQHHRVQACIVKTSNGCRSLDGFCDDFDGKKPAVC